MKSNKIRNLENQKGIASLMTVIIACGIISLIVLPLSLQVYFLRSSSLAKELKEQSKLSAESCLKIVMILISEFGEENLEEVQATGASDCKIISIQHSGNNYIIKLESKSAGFRTALQATVEIPSNKILISTTS